MADWIERYRAGEHVEVWAEMQALGAEIRETAFLEAAREVAQETMARSRSNVLTLFDRLVQIGYRFQGPPEPETPDYALELRLHGALEYVAAKGGRKYRDNPWLHPALAWVDEEEVELPAHYRNGRPGRANYRPANAHTAARLDEIERRLGGILPVAVRCWFETIGSVDFAGAHPILNRTGDVATLRVTLDGLAPAADAGAGFISAIRHAFHWAGFPGWADVPNAPERELTWLRSGLLPV
jgi:hypothetical protein